MKILGISSFYHDSSASIIEDGVVLIAIQEERLTRIKHDNSFPLQAIKKCLSEKNLIASDIDAVVFFEKPFLKFERLLETYLAFAPAGIKSFMKAMPVWIEEKLFQKKIIQDELKALGFTQEQCKNLLFSDHHLSHAASAFFPSPFEKSIVLTMDGVGEWSTTCVYVGNGNNLELKKKINFPHSLGLLYSAFTAYCGFKVNSGEYKLMGLAPYGRDIYKDLIKTHLIDIKDDGSYKLNLDYFNYCAGLTMTNKKFDHLFGNVQRNEETELQQVHMDLAASIQSVTEEVLLKMCSSLRNEYQIHNICLAGGVALNCVANGKLLKNKIFDNIWIQPASGDAGGSLGAALACYYIHFAKNRTTTNNEDDMQGAYLGNEYSTRDIIEVLEKENIKFQSYESDELINQAASYLENAMAIGWFQGKMEFGPRSLGNRSIIADARHPSMQKTLNLKIKFRESFRPFAPAILEEEVQNYFPNITKSPYMLLVDEIKEEYKNQLTDDQKKLKGIELLNVVRSQFPAITHIDYSSRVQTVSKATNPKFHALLKKFFEKTKSPIVANTSFNIRGEPIVCSPHDALKCFLGTDLDILIMENIIVKKSDIENSKLIDYRNQFELD